MVSYNLCIEYLLKNYDLIVAECKYLNKKVEINILQSLKEKSKNIKTTLKIKHYILFVKVALRKTLKI